MQQLTADADISTGEVPRVAEPLAVIVSVLVPVVVTGLKVAVTPAGNSGAESVTEPENAPIGSTVTVDVVELPRTILTGMGEMPSWNAGTPMFSATVLLAVCVPEYPSIVTMVRLLGGAELLAVSVRILDPVVGSGVHAAVTPAGSADATARLTLPLNPS